MFHFTKPDTDAIKRAVSAACDQVETRPRVLSLLTGLDAQERPLGLAHDQLRSCIGRGEATFAAARRAFAHWAEFDLGWVRVANPEIPVSTGQIVAVEVHAFGLWSLNLSWIVETVDTESLFGFLYATTPHHAEQGEERFILEFDATDGGVWYQLEAVSRPRHPLARLAYPLTRGLQHQFARDSHRRMSKVVSGTSGERR